MTATDELRNLLDERGVEWWPMHDDEAGYRDDRDTEFLVYGCKHVAHEWGCRLQVDMLTPEQAIAATLGRGTCEWILEHSGTLYDKWRCSNCGYLFVESRVDQGIKDGFDPNYCPSCGKVVEQ